MDSASDAEFHILSLSSENFQSAVVESNRDKLIMLYKSKGCEKCNSLAVYYKRVALRFWEMGLSTKIDVCRMEVTEGINLLLPGVELGSLPVVLLLQGEAQ